MEDAAQDQMSIDTANANALASDSNVQLNDADADADADANTDAETMQVKPSSEDNDTLQGKQMEINSKIQYDDVCNPNDEVVRLTKENAELKDKIAEYISSIGKLERENKSLQNDYDESLMKISELSFECARLKVSVEELSKNNSSSKQYSKSKCQNAYVANSMPVSYQYKNNGYGSWN